MTDISDKEDFQQNLRRICLPVPPSFSLNEIIIWERTIGVDPSVRLFKEHGWSKAAGQSGFTGHNS